MTTKNHNLSQAKIAKNDEFYTQYHDIDKEIRSYLQYNLDLFKDKVVLLPCDDPTWSNFTKFFIDCFNELGLKKLISTCCAQDDDSLNGKGKVLILCRNTNDSDAKNACQWDYLQGNGDFRSDEVSALRYEADIIITNPPFSLFREFLTWIMNSGKQFAIIGNMNAIAYKEIFGLLKNNQLWLGVHKIKFFATPCDNNARKNIEWRDGSNFAAFGNVCWFTNITHGKRYDILKLNSMEWNLNDKLLNKHQHAYQRYENYNAIEVPKVKAIPSDYKGVMGVPISFLEKYNPVQFEILGMCENEDLYQLKTRLYNTLEKQEAYFAKFNKKGSYDLNASAVLSINGKLHKVYQRILIRHKSS